MLKYFRRRKKGKLYRQWVERASLPPDTIPREKVPEDMIPQADKADKQQSRLNILSILLGIALVVLCAGLILLMVYSC
ncbi:hypothetical protein ES707_16891 [subsurface metagenome]|jgi:hypothetical protein